MVGVLERDETELEPDMKALVDDFLMAAGRLARTLDQMDDQQELVRIVREFKERFEYPEGF